MATQITYFGVAAEQNTRGVSDRACSCIGSVLAGNVRAFHAFTAVFGGGVDCFYTHTDPIA